MDTERLHLVAEEAGNGGCHENRAPERPGEALHMAGLVDGGADDREVKPLRRTNIAEEDLARVQGDAGAQGAPAVDGGESAWLRAERVDGR